MIRRPKFRHGIKLGRIIDRQFDEAAVKLLSDRVSYFGSVLHKTYPSPAGDPAHRSDKAKCGYYSKEQWPQLSDALKEGIRAKCFSEFRGDFPERVWVKINGVLHEARLTNQDTGEYHGFPLFDERQYPEPYDKALAAPDVKIHAAN